jgi:hypothetical protein
VLASYFEQNDVANNDPRIHFDAGGASPLSSVLIQGNEFSKQLQGASQRLIHVAYANNVTIADNWSAYGDQTDRYSVELGTSVSNYRVELMAVPSGSTAYPIRFSSANYTQGIASRALLRDGFETGYAHWPLNVQSSNYTLAMADVYRLVQNGGASTTYTIPPNSTVAFPIGTCVRINNLHSANNLTIARGAGVSLYLSNTDQNVTMGPRRVADFCKVNTDVWIAMNASGLS